MSPLLAWTSFVVACFSLFLNVYQRHAQSLAKAVMDHHRDQLLGIKTSLIQLRAGLQEAHDQLPIFKSAHARVWIGTVGHKDKMIEHQVDIMLGIIRLPTKKLSRLKRLWRVLFPLAVPDQMDDPVWASTATRLAQEGKYAPRAAPGKTGP